MDFLYDDTLLKNCKASLMITDIGVHGKSNGMEPFHFAFSGIESIETKLNALFINEKHVFNFNRLDPERAERLAFIIKTVKDGYAAGGFFPQLNPQYPIDPRFVKKKTKTKRSADAGTGASAPTSVKDAPSIKDDPADEARLAKVKERLFYMSSLFVSPNIPSAALENAAGRLAPGADPSAAVLLYDKSESNSPDACFLCSPAGLSLRNSKGETAFFPAGELRFVKLQPNSVISVNDSFFMDLPGASEREAGAVSAYLSGFYRLGGASALMSLISSWTAESGDGQSLLNKIASVYSEVEGLAAKPTEDEKREDEEKSADEEGAGESDAAEEDDDEDDDFGDDDDDLSSLLDY
ncbi:MAG: hypothetical protein LBR53_02365 [Deltaproteobacteria bacterium]|nr:hypothetical protein [Deltaproteobacteria bacterium]